jgi:hypothetical protein
VTGLIKCARVGCIELFQPATHNQKFHDSECCRIATNARIMQKYYEQRDRRQGKVRICISCDTKLSRYNDDQVCASCTIKEHVSANKSVTDMLLAVSWQA